MLFCASAAQAAEFRVLIDSDANAATGCTVATAGGNFTGVETILVTSINTGVAPPVVTGITTQNCASPPGVFGAPVLVDPGGWPLGAGVGVGGFDAIETYFPNPPAKGVWRLGFVYWDGAVGEDVVLDAPGGGPILFSFDDTSAIPALTPGGGALLTLVIAALMFARLRKMQMRAGRMLLVPVFALMLAGQLWAAIAVILDGQVGDWADVGPLVQDATNDVPPGADLSAVFVKKIGSRIYFRGDVKTSGAPAAVADTYSVLAGTPLAVAASGLLANDALGTPSATVSSFGGGTLGGTVTTNAAGTTVALGGGGSLTVNANGGLNYTPPAGFTGTFTFNYRMGNGVGTADALVTISVNQAPAITSPNTTTFTVGSAGSFSVTATGYPTPTLALSGCTLPTGISFGGGTLSGTPASGTGGTYNCVLTAANGIGSNAVQNFTLKVNQNLAFTSANTLNLVGGQPTNLPFTITTSGSPAVNSIILGGSLPSGVSFSYVPGASTAQLTGTPTNGSGAGGPYALSLTAANGVTPNATQTLTINVADVNLAPSFTKGADQTVLEDAGPQTVNGWATAISKGAAWEGAQTLTFQVTGNTNPGLFSAGPAVSATGVLTYTPAADANGSATVTLVLHDSGGTANGGSDTSAPQSFVINVTPVNDAPSFAAGPNQSALHNVGARTVNPWATAISAGPANEAGQTLGFQITGNTNGALFSAGPAVSPTGVLTYTTAGPGAATITLVLQDNGGTANGGVDTSAPQSFTIVAQQPPAITSGASASFTVGAAGSFTFTGTGYPTPINFSLSGCTLPSGLGVSGVGNSILSGTPSSGTGGSYVCVLTASNGVAPDATQNPFTVTVQEPPVVGNDAYPETILGNVPADSANVSGGPFSVVSNDTSSTPATITAYDATSAHGGSVSMTTSGPNMGRFTYIPPPGYEGADTFTYTLTNSGGSAVGTVTLNISGMVWFIDNNAGGAGDGRLGSPFNTLAAFQAVNNGAGTHPKANDTVFLYESVSAYTGGVTLLNGQKLVGQDATESLAMISGLSPAPSNAALPVMNSANGTTVLLTYAGGTAVSLGSGNTLKGLSLGTAAAALSGNGFGTLVTKDVAINNPVGAALVLNNGSFAAGSTFSGVTSGAGTNNIGMTSVGGGVDLGGGTLSGASGSAFSLSGGSGSVNYSGGITETGNAPAINIVNKTGGSVILSGVISGTGGNRGVFLNNNTGASVSFTGPLTLSTGANAAFTATGGGTVTATNSISTLATTTGTALNVTNTMIGAGGLVFGAISANGGANGIVLDNTCGGNCASGAIGGLRVEGDGINTSVGGNASGGTLSNMAGADGAAAGNAVYLNQTRNVVLRRMTINGTNQNHAIRGQAVEGFTLEYATVGGSNGTNTAGVGEGSVYFGNQIGTTGITGSATVTGSVIGGGYARNFSLVNTSGTLNRLTVTNTTFNQTQAGSSETNLAVEARNNATVVNATVTGSTFLGAAGDQANFTGQAGTTMDIVFQNNTLTNTHPGNVIGGGGTTVASQGILTFNASNNSQTGANGSGATLFKATNGTSYRGTYASNTLGTQGVAGSGSATANGIYPVFGGAGTIALAMTGNGIHGYNGNGGIWDDNTDGTYSVDLTVTGNTTTTPNPMNSFSGLAVTAGAPSSADNIQVCAGISGNDFSAGDPANANDVLLGVSTGPSRMKLPGYAGSTVGQVQSFVQGNNLNPGTTAVTAYVDPPAVDTNFIGGSACALP